MKRQSNQFLASGAALVAAALTVVAGVTPPAQGQRHVPPPCAADGTCLPNQGAWGHYKTNWHRWPGDVEAEPTPADTTDDDQGATLPEGPLTPPAVDEEQRGATTSDRRRPAAGEPGGAVVAPPTDPDGFGPAGAPTGGPTGGPGILSPDVEDPSIDFDSGPSDPFGSINEHQPAMPSTVGAQVQPAGAFQHDSEGDQPAPTLREILKRQQEDAPPALPPSLSGVAQQSPRGAVGRASEPPTDREQFTAEITDLPLDQPTSLRVVANPQPTRRHAATGIQQTAWAGGAATGVINPTGDSLTDRPDEGVRQAIYVEASDM